MKVMFRTDASIEIGIGHVMRCLTLADVLKERGADCEFICREHQGNQLGLIHERGYKTHALPIQDVDDYDLNNLNAAASMHAAWLGADWRADAEQVRAEIGSTMADWLIVDHYALDSRWEREMKGQARQLMVIDDLADRPHDCDVLLDQNLGRTAQDYVGLVPQHCCVLTGLGYALLRPEFAAMREYSLGRRIEPVMHHLLISMGGVDKDNATGQVLEAMKRCPFPVDSRIVVAMGATAPWLDAVRAMAVEMPWLVEVRVNVSNMAQLMANSDLAIGSAGSTSWERCCMGLPTLLVILADNQRSGAVAMEAAGVASLLGEKASIWQNLPGKLDALLSGDNLQLMRQRCLSLVDGNGADRIVKILMDAYD